MIVTGLVPEKDFGKRTVNLLDRVRVPEHVGGYPSFTRPRTSFSWIPDSREEKQ